MKDKIINKMRILYENGCGTDVIAQVLNISTNTAWTHTKNILQNNEQKYKMEFEIFNNEEMAK